MSCEHKITYTKGRRPAFCKASERWSVFFITVSPPPSVSLLLYACILVCMCTQQNGYRVPAGEQLFVHRRLHVRRATRPTVVYTFIMTCSSSTLASSDRSRDLYPREIIAHSLHISLHSSWASAARTRFYVRSWWSSEWAKFTTDTALLQSDRTRFV